MRFENLATRLFFGAAVAALIAAAIPSRASASLAVEAVGCGGPGSPVCAATTKGSTTYYDYYN